MRRFNVFEVHLQRKYASLGVDLDEVSIRRIASDLAAWIYGHDFAYLNDRSLAPQPTQFGTLRHAEA